MTGPVRIVAVLAPRWSGATALAAALSRNAAEGRLPAGVTMPTDGAWFGRFRDGISVHPELIELAGGRRDADPNPPEPSATIVHPVGPAVRVGDRTEPWRVRPPQSRQSVRDRLRRVTADAREAGQHTVLLIVPGGGWEADPDTLRRELRAVADDVTFALLVRRPEFAVTAALAASVRLADYTGQRGLGARSIAAQRTVRDELRIGALIARWSDADATRGGAPVPIPASDDPAVVWASIGVDPRVGQRATPTSPAPDSTATGDRPAAVGVVVPPLSRRDLESIATLARRRARWAVTPRGLARREAELDALRDAADGRAVAGGASFGIAAAEARGLARRYRRDLDAVRAAVSQRWPAGVPADATHGALREAWIAWFADEAPR